MTNRVDEEILCSFSVADLTGALDFYPINVLGLIDPCCNIRIINNSSVNIFISYDGIVAHDFIPYEYVLNVNIRSSTDSDVKFSRGKIIYVSGTLGKGYVYLAGYTQ